MRNEPPDLEAAALIKSSLTVPMYYNGDCKSYQEALEIAQRTKADGTRKKPTAVPGCRLRLLG